MTRHFRLLSAVRARTVRVALRERGWAQRAVIVAFLAIGAAVFFGAFFFFSRAFGFVSDEPFSGPVIARYVLESGLLVVFLLGVASFVSAGGRFIFASEEVRYLTTLPVRPVTLFAHRLAGAAAFSSWPILILGVPAIVAFGDALDAGPAYYLGATLVLMLFLAAIVASGALLSFLLAPLFGRLRRRNRLILRAAGTVAFLFVLVRAAVPRGIFGDFFLAYSAGDAAERMDRIRDWYFLSPARPFTDLIASVLPYGDVDQGVMFMGILTVVLLAFVLLFSVARRRYVATVQLYGETGFLARAEDIGPVHPRHAFPAIFRWRHGYLFEKDLLSFFRDPDEVSRAAFLGTLLLLYIVAARGVMRLEGIGPSLPAIALIFAFGTIGYFCLAFALRFVFPSLSREGKSAWVLWSSPVHVHEFFSWKMFFWSFLIALGAGTASVLTVLLFRLPVPLAAFFVFAALCMSVGTVAIALGQGTMFPDLREDDPDVLSTSPAGLATTGIGLAYVFVISRYVHAFASYAIAGGTDGKGLLDGFGILIVTVGVVALYWVLAPRSMASREFS